MDWAMRAHIILGCKGVTRSDFRYDENTENVYMLEINTQPGMTKTSLVPEQAQYNGIDMVELVKRIIKTASYEK